MSRIHAAALPPRSARRPVGLATCLAAAALLAACAGSPPTRYHSLASIGATAPAGYAGPPIALGAVQIPPAMARDELIREAGDGPFQVREFDHWAAPLGRLARQALAEDLATRLPPGMVVFPGAAWPPPGVLLSVDVLSFRSDAGSATMVLSWSLRPIDPVPALAGSAAAAAAPAPLPRGAQLRLQTPAGDGAEATARAWSELLGQLADRVLADLPRGPAAP